MNTNFQQLNQKQIVNALKILRMPLFLGFLKKLKKEDKLKSDDIDNELIKYIKLKMTK